MKTTGSYRFSGLLRNRTNSDWANPILPARYFQVVTRNGECLIGLTRTDLEGIDSASTSRLEAGELKPRLDNAGSLSGWALWKDHEEDGVELSLRGRVLVMARDVLEIRELAIEEQVPALAA